MGCISEQEEYIVLTTALKHLEVFLLSTGKRSLLCHLLLYCFTSSKLEKKCSAMETRLFKETEYLIIGDKVGDIMAFDLPKLVKKTFLIGHCATVITGLVRGWKWARE